MLRHAANLTLLFPEVAFEKRFAAAAQAGFAAVEFLFPYEYLPSDIAALAWDAGVDIVMFNLPPGDWDAGERGIAAFPDRVAEFDHSLETAMGYASACRVRRLHIMAGLAAGADWATYLRNLARACSANPAMTFLIEPISPAGIPSYLLSDFDKAIEVINGVAMSNLKLQLDLFHSAMLGLDVLPFIECNAAHIGHVQIAGAPGRNEPDSGEVDHAPALRLLNEIGYEGWIGAEYHPLGRTEDGLGWRERLP